MKVTIIVLSYNNYEDTAECLDSLATLEYPDYAVTVIDNGSTDDSARKIEKRFPDYRFIVNEANLGYAEGNNVGLRRALKEGADLVWLLNNDTVVHPAALSRLVEAAEADPRAGLIGSQVYFYSEPERIHFAGGKLSRPKGLGLHLGMGSVDEGSDRLVRETDFVTGASLMARSSMIRQVGLLDAGFFLYMEDLDWALRAKKSGWKVVLAPASHIRHKVGETSLQRRPLIIYYVCRNSLKCCRKNYPRWLPVVILVDFQRFVLNYLGRYLLYGRAPGELDHARMGWRGIADFLAGRTGEFAEIRQRRKYDG